MSRAATRVLGLAAVAALALGPALPALAGTSEPTPSAAPTTTPTPTPTPTGGSLTVTVVPVTSTYPPGRLPDLAGLQFDIVDTSQDDGTPATGSCTATADPGDPGASCPQNGPESTWTQGDGYRVSVDASTPLPAHTFIPAATGTLPGCTAHAGSGSPSGCPDTVVLHAYGRYRHVGLVVQNSATHLAVANATYELCAVTCSSGSTPVATATTDPHGTLAFAGWFTGAQAFSIEPVTTPPGYEAAASQQLALPAATTPTESGSVFRGSAALHPKRPILRNLFRVTPEGTAITIDVFDRAIAVSPPLKLIGLGKPAHGTATDPHADATYTPDKGFVGFDNFTYSARNRLGGTSTATVTVKVTAPAAAAAATLPNTGAPIIVLLGWASWAISMGSFLVVASRRRRGRRGGRFAGTAPRLG